MPLIDLQTNLKSLKYGKDRFNEGNSGQPYITTDPDGNTNLSVGTSNILRLIGVNQVPLIPNISTRLSRSRIGRFVNQVVNTDDFIRGGALGSVQASINDTFRIGAFLTSLPKGPIFVAKQVGLQLSNPKLEVKKGLKGVGSSILGSILSANPSQALGTLTGGILGPTRIYNLGINTLAQVPANAFGVHFVRHGLLPAQDQDSKYENVVTFNNQGKDSPNNRLVELKKNFSLGDRAFEATGDYDQARKNVNDQNRGLRKDYRSQKKLYRQEVRNRKSLNRQLDSAEAGGGEGISRAPKPTKPKAPKYIKFKPADLTISSYITGPGSTYGIGSTILKRYTFTEDQLKNDEARSNSETYAGKSRLDGNVIDYTEGLGSEADISIQYHPEIGATDKNTLTTTLSQGINATYAALQSKVQSQSTLTQSGSYNGTYTTSPVTGSTISTTNPHVLRGAADFRYYGSGSVSITGSRKEYNNSNVFSRTDAGIMSVIFRAVNPFGQPVADPDRPGVNKNEDRFVFNAYMTGYKDDFVATWNDINYAGRAESFYIYNKFKRTVSFNLKVPCFNKKQLFEKHRALGQLASTTAGSYNNNLLGGVLVKVNLGNYLVGEYAILNNVSYSIPDDASWDIADDALLAMYLDASFSLTIVHKNLPQFVQQDAKSGFFGYLPDTESGFITPKEIVSKFTKG